MLAIGFAIDDVIDYRIQIKLFAVKFIGNARQLFRLHQLKLMTDGRDDAADRWYEGAHGPDDPIAKAKVPLFAIHGDSDTVVWHTGHDDGVIAA